MLDNLRTNDILLFLRIGHIAEDIADFKREIIVLVFHTNASKFSRKWRRDFTDKYMEIQNLYLWLCVRDFISQI